MFLLLWKICYIQINVSAVTDVINYSLDSEDWEFKWSVFISVSEYLKCAVFSVTERSWRWQQQWIYIFLSCCLLSAYVLQLKVFLPFKFLLLDLFNVISVSFLNCKNTFYIKNYYNWFINYVVNVELFLNKWGLIQSCTKFKN